MLSRQGRADGGDASAAAVGDGLSQEAAAVAERMAQPGIAELKDGTVTWQAFCEEFVSGL